MLTGDKSVTSLGHSPHPGVRPTPTHLYLLSTSVFSFSQNYSHIIIPILARDPAINNHHQQPSNPILHPPSQSLVINKTTLKYLVTTKIELELHDRDSPNIFHLDLTILEVFVVTLTMDRVKIFMDASVNLNVSCSLRGRQPGREAPPSLADADLQLSS